MFGWAWFEMGMASLVAELWDWKRINYPSRKNKRFKKVIQQLLLVCFVKKNIYPAYFLNHKVSQEIQTIHLMISNGEDDIILQ